MVDKRNPILVLALTIVTFGIYGIYWIWKTKNDINSLGGKIPPMYWWVALVIPVVNFFVILYWMYLYFDSFGKVVTKDNSGVKWTLIYVVGSIVVIGPLYCMYAVQTELNKIA